MIKKEGWEKKTLGEVLQKTESIDPTRTPEKEFIYIDVSSVDNKTFTIETTTLLQGKNAPSRARKLIRKNDVLFATVRPTLKRIAIIPNELNEQVCSIGYFVLRVKDIIEYKFLYYYLRSERFINNMEKLQKGAGYPAVSDSQIREQIIFFPKSLSTQQQIVSELDTLSSIINKKKQQQEELDKLAQATFYDMFGDPVSNEKGWEVKKLGTIGLLGRGVSKNRPRNAPELLGGVTPLIQTGDIANAGMYLTEYSQTYSQKGLEQSKLWSKNTLCITIAANIGKTSIMTFDACFPDSVVGFTPNSDIVNVIFVYYFFSSIQKELEDNAPQVAQKNINLEILNKNKSDFTTSINTKSIFRKN